MADPVGVSCRIETEDFITPALRERMDRLGRAELAQLLDNIGSGLETYAQMRFEQKVGPDGKAWADYSPNTTFRARRERPQMLRDNGGLYDSVAREGVHEVLLDKKAVRIGTNLEYARIHQLGGMAGRGRKVRIPARPYLGVSDGDRQSILGLVRDFLEDA